MKDLMEAARKEIDKHASDTFEAIYKSCSEESFSSLNTTTHPNIECDKCGIFPIVGVRYKCCVCKNFDFCERCEEQVDHEHPFIKINRPGDAPQAIFTGVFDNQN